MQYDLGDYMTHKNDPDNKTHSNGKLSHMLLPQRPKIIKLARKATATKAEGVNLATKATVTKAESVNLTTKAIATKVESVNLPQRLNTMTPLYILYDACLNNIRSHSPKNTGDQRLPKTSPYHYLF